MLRKLLLAGEYAVGFAIAVSMCTALVPPYLPRW